MIALAILALSMVALSGAVGVSLRGVGISQKTEIALQLARFQMNEQMMAIEEDIARGAFPDPQEKHGNFKEPYEDFQWRFEIRKIEIPTLHLPTEVLSQFSAGSSTADGSGGGEAMTPGIGGAVEGEAQKVMKQISDSIREIELTVFWGDEKQEEGGIHFKTHLAKMK